MSEPVFKPGDRVRLTDQVTHPPDLKAGFKPGTEVIIHARRGWVYQVTRDGYDGPPRIMGSHDLEPMP